MIAGSRESDRAFRTEPQNAISGAAYQGKNAIALAIAAESYGYPTGSWVTFKQALSIGRCVRKGEHGIRILKVVEDKVGPKRRGLRSYTVFNIAQTDELLAIVPAIVRDPGEDSADRWAEGQVGL